MSTPITRDGMPFTYFQCDVCGAIYVFELNAIRCEESDKPGKEPPPEVLDVDFEE